MPELIVSTQPAAQPSQIFIVRRGRESTFRLLAREFGEDPSVRIIWDRRHEQRRRSTQATSGDRRHGERRTLPPTIWPPTNYLVVNVK